MAVLAALDRLEGHLHLGAVGCIDQADVDLDSEVATLRGSAVPAAGAGAAEEGVEEVADRAECVEVGSVTARAQTIVAVAVVGGTALGVGQDLVGLGRLL